MFGTLPYLRTIKIKNMSKENSRNDFSREAMQYGTILGFIWIVASAMYLIGLSTPSAMLLFIVIILSTPFLAGRWTIKHRKNECDNKMDFIQAFTFLFIMFMCASLLTSVSHYIYFRFIDNGYLIQLVNDSIDLALQSSEILSIENIEILQQTKNILNEVTPMDWTLSFLSTNIICGAILSPIIALFVKK